MPPSSTLSRVYAYAYAYASCMMRAVAMHTIPQQRTAVPELLSPVCSDKAWKFGKHVALVLFLALIIVSRSTRAPRPPTGATVTACLYLLSTLGSSHAGKPPSSTYTHARAHNVSVNLPQVIGSMVVRNIAESAFLHAPADLLQRTCNRLGTIGVSRANEGGQFSRDEMSFLLLAHCSGLARERLGGGATIDYLYASGVIPANPFLLDGLWPSADMVNTYGSSQTGGR
jgi:hypothetical protein